MSQTLKQMLDNYEKWLFAEELDQQGSDIEMREQVAEATVGAEPPYGWTLAQYEELCELYITLVRQSASNYNMARVADSREA